MTLSQNIHDTTNLRNGEYGLALLYLSFLLYLKFWKLWLPQPCL